jgi:integrase
VRFTRSYANIRGGVAVKLTKTGVKNRLALDDRTVELLRAHRRRSAERALAAGVPLPPDAFVSPARGSVDGSEPWSPNAATKRWEALRRKVKGAESVHAHDLRHWLATTMFAEGHDPVEVAGRGGWSSPAVPFSTYGHFRPAKDQEAAADLAARLDG